MAAHYMLTSDLLRQDSPTMKDEDQQGQQGHQGPKVPAPQVQKAGGFLLQYRLGSTHQLPGKPLSSRAEPDRPKLHTGPPQHGPEDGSIYAVSDDPGVWVRGGAAQWGGEGEARRSSVGSTAIFSGGRGHRRLGGSPAGAPERVENTLLVWQLPLTATQ